MSTQAIAKRYAQALLDEAVSRELESTVERDFVTINEIAEASPDLRMLFRSPIIEWWRKKNIVKEILQDRVNDLTMNFVVLVIEKGRERFIREIIAQYLRMLDLRRNILRIDVDSAKTLDEATRQSVVDAVGKQSGMTVMAEFDEVPELIGGLRVTIGDKVYDGSLRAQLEDLRERLQMAEN